MSVWIVYGVPVGGLLFAAVSLLYLRHSAHSFDKKYGQYLPPGE